MSKASVSCSSGTDSCVKAVCDWYGPTDLLQIVDDERVRKDLALDAPGSPIGELLGGRVRDHRDLAHLASPISFVSSSTPPFLIVHGDADDVVPIQQSETLEAALKKAGTDVTLARIKGGGHGTHEFWGKENEKRAIDFFERTLKAPN